MKSFRAMQFVATPKIWYKSLIEPCHDVSIFIINSFVLCIPAPLFSLPIKKFEASWIFVDGDENFWVSNEYEIIQFKGHHVLNEQKFRFSVVFHIQKQKWNNLRFVIPFSSAMLSPFSPKSFTLLCHYRLNYHHVNSQLVY